MRVIDFLPDDYLRRQRARRSNLLCLAIAGGSLIVVGLVVSFLFVQAMSMTAMRTVIEQQYEQASLRIDDLNQLEERKSGLLHKVDLSAALLERVPRSNILARLTNYLPPSTSLTSLAMQVDKRQVLVPAPPPPPARKGGPPPSPSARKPKPQKITVTEIRFRLDGLAETDVQVAEYISRIGTDRLFDDVDLQFSEDFPYKEGVTLRRFQLCFRLSDDADKVLQDVTGKVGQADSPAPETAKGDS